MASNDLLISTQINARMFTQWDNAVVSKTLLTKGGYLIDRSRLGTGSQLLYHSEWR